MEYMENAMQNLMSSEMARNAEPLMAQPTHDEVIAWIDKEVKFIDEIHPNGGNSKNVTSFWTNYRASLLANRAGLERHKPEIRYVNEEFGGSFDNEEEALDGWTIEDGEDEKPTITTFIICSGCGRVEENFAETNGCDDWVYSPEIHDYCPTYTEIYDPIVSVM